MKVKEESEKAGLKLNIQKTKIMVSSPICCCCCKVASGVSDSVWPHRWQPTRLLCPWDSPGKNTGVVCHFLLQSSPITSWQIDGETMETVKDFIFLGSKISADGDCSHEIKRCLFLGRNTMTNLDSILKSRDITLLTKVHLVKTLVFPVVMYGYEKAEHQRINAFELWCWRRLLRVPWTARRSNQSILKENSP